MVESERAAKWLHDNIGGTRSDWAQQRDRESLTTLLNEVREETLLEALGATKSDCACHGAVRSLLRRG